MQQVGNAIALTSFILGSKRRLKRLICVTHKLCIMAPMKREQGKSNLEEKYPIYGVLLGSPSKKLGFYPWQPILWTWRESMNFNFSPNITSTIKANLKKWKIIKLKNKTRNQIPKTKPLNNIHPPSNLAAIYLFVEFR